MTKKLLTIVGATIILTGCSITRMYDGITLEGFPTKAKFSKDCTSGKMEIGPFRSIKIVAEENRDKDKILNDIIITAPSDYPVRTTSKKAYESDLPEEHPLSKYANRNVLQTLYNELNQRICVRELKK
jgi:hypothetical protein